MLLRENKLFTTIHFTQFSQLRKIAHRDATKILKLETAQTGTPFRLLGSQVPSLEQPKAQSARWLAHQLSSTSGPETALRSDDVIQPLEGWRNTRDGLL